MGKPRRKRMHSVEASASDIATSRFALEKRQNQTEQTRGIVRSGAPPASHKGANRRVAESRSLI